MKAIIEFNGSVIYERIFPVFHYLGESSNSACEKIVDEVKSVLNQDGEGFDEKTAIKIIIRKVNK